MTTPRRIVLGLLLILCVLVVVVAVRTWTYRPASVVAPVELASAPAIDLERATAHIGEAVRIRTVSHQEAAENDVGEWDRLHAWLQATYPAAHLAMMREVVADRTLVYTWQGSDPALPAIILMAHQDVVPVTPGSEGHWKHPPFEGVIADGAVWGRGAIDDKGSLVALFESLEALATSGFVPRRTVIVVSGHDEEAGGTGARAAAVHLRERNVRAEFALDEGYAVIDGLPLVQRPVALIGIGEKGYATLKVTAATPGGHSSAPPPETGVETLARAVLAITGAPFPLEFSGPAADMVRGLAAHARPIVRMAVANEWLFRPLLVRQLASTPTGAASLHTTIAPTMLRGSPKENVLPQDAAAWINYRIAPQDTAADVMERARRATDGLAVKLEWEGGIAYDPAPVSSTQSEAYRLLATLAADGGRLPVAPGLVNATTDSRHMVGVATDIYRFQPIVVALDELPMIHGTNEHLTLDNLRRLCEFYARLIATAAR
ncbi:MAG TPA: M20 family peptidase [Steroidobacteraceae bacterium]|jgi:carboxypeptidase PM20D1|nr:M20 family peptidase [Steroidobacteraceae bacterium]